MILFWLLISLISEMSDNMVRIDNLFPDWMAMWLAVAALFFLGKLAMLARAAGLPGWRGWAWLLAWPGMETRCWRRGRERKALPALPRSAGLAAMVAGAWLIWGAARLLPHPLLAGWAGMIGVVLLLHFGWFRWLAGFWQRRGVAVTPIMNRPLFARGVAEFWGSRWNLAFRDLARELVALPLAKAHGSRTALWAVFLLSGLLHELVISLPADTGYGLPTLYFLWQAAAIEWEKRLRLGGHAWVALMTGLPALLLLFHPPFVERVMLPFLTFLGALP